MTNSIHQTAVSLELITTSQIPDEIKIGRTKSIKYRKSVRDVKEWTKMVNTATLLPNSLPEFMSLHELRNILKLHTTIVRHNYHETQSKHPWTRDKAYRSLYTRVRIFRRQMNRSDREHLVHYNQIASELRQLYDVLKSKYYADVVASGFRQPGHFYRFINSIRKPGCNIPSIMCYDSRYYTPTII